MLVELTGVRKSYPLPGDDGSLVALDGIDLAVASGQTCIVRGPSGSGKTTLLALAGGLARPTSGSIRLDGVELCPKLHRRPELISWAFQEAAFVPELTVQENLLLPLIRCKGRVSVERGERLLEAFGLTERFDLLPSALSGGEKRRLTLARALICPTRLLLLDEPTSYLDEAWSVRVMEVVMAEARAAQATLIIATHQPVPGSEGCRVVRMERGKVIRDGDNNY
jgi:putative ABC transport system ATP-binding protein